MGRLVAAGRAAAPELGERLIEVHYEDLLNDPRAGIERLYAHIGLEGGIESLLAAAAPNADVGRHDKRVVGSGSGATHGAVVTGATSSRRQATSCESWATTKRMR